MKHVIASIAEATVVPPITASFYSKVGIFTPLKAQ